MINNLIIGSGFSSYLTSLFLADKSYKIISLKTINIIENKSFRRKNLESHSKYCYNKIKSFGVTKFILSKKIILHDTLSHGGNTVLWGGFFRNILHKKDLIFFKKNKIYLKKLSIQTTGCCSNSKLIYQLQNKKKILNVNNKFKNLIDGYVEKIEYLRFKKIFKVYYLKKKIKKILFAKNIYLGVGLIQLIDLLIKSSFLKHNYKMSVEEFAEEKKISFKKNYFPEALTIKYSLSGILKHFFNISNIKYLRFFDLIPVYINQVFKEKINQILLKVNLNSMKINIVSKNFSSFGTSIHYCNLKINNIPAQIFLDTISKNLRGVGMPFVKQEKPGPISNDIFLLIKNTFKK